MRNFHLLGTVQVTQLVDALHRQPQLWNQYTIRTKYPLSPHYGVDDILLRFNGLQKVDKVMDDTSCHNYPALQNLTQARPILFDLARMVEATQIGRVIITRLEPGRAIAAHVDGGASATFYKRYQVCLESEPGCVFRCRDEVVQMQPGQVWFFRNDLEHEVVNNSAADRLAMIVDLRVED